LQVTLECGAGAPRLKVRQSRYAPLGSAIDPRASWTVPFCATLGSGSGRSDFCALLEDEEASLPLAREACPDWVHPNADGAGYYRFALDDAGWQRLIGQARTLGTAEALVLADSLDAAFRAGRVPAELYVSGMAALAGHEAWEVVSAATASFEGFIDIFDRDQLPAMEKALRAIVGPRLAQLSDARDAASILLRQDLQRFLAVIARDPVLRKRLAGQAAAVIGLTGKADPSAAPATEYETVFTAGVQELGEPFFDLLLEKALASDDPAFRRAALGALARTEDPALARRLQAAILSGKVKGTEAVRMISRQMVRHATTELTYAWFEANAAAVIDLVPESFRSVGVPGFGRAFCSAERAEEWQAFIAAHAGELPGHERSLAQTLESIHLCAALKEGRAADLLAAFRAHGS
jgi:alanyl aminopeptidase